MKLNNKRIIPESNIVTQILDLFLTPFMWILGGFKFPLQETHKWHVRRVDKNLLKNKKFATVNKTNNEAKFYHDSRFGVFHMPIFGGLRKYVVCEVDKFQDHWHVGWANLSSLDGSVHTLKIKDKGVKLLFGRNFYRIFAVDDSGRSLNVKIVGYGEIGDNKFNKYRLF